jgi:hypothetical protein
VSADYRSCARGWSPVEALPCPAGGGRVGASASNGNETALADHPTLSAEAVDRTVFDRPGHHHRAHRRLILRESPIGFLSLAQAASPLASPAMPVSWVLPNKGT